MAVRVRITSIPLIFLLLCSALLATTLQGVQGEVDVEGPSESECRPYIEKALKQLETGDTQSADVQDDDITHIVTTDDSDTQSGEAIESNEPISVEEGTQEVEDEQNASERDTREIESVEVESAREGETVETVISNIEGPKQKPNQLFTYLLNFFNFNVKKGDTQEASAERRAEESREQADAEGATEEADGAEGAASVEREQEETDGTEEQRSEETAEDGAASVEETESAVSLEQEEGAASVEDGAASVEEEIATSVEEAEAQASANEGEAAASAEDTASVEEPAAASTEEVAASAEEAAASVEEAASAEEEASTEETVASVEEAAGSAEATASTEEATASVEEAAGSAEEAAGSAEEAAASAEEAAGSTEEAVASAEDGEASEHQEEGAASAEEGASSTEEAAGSAEETAEAASAEQEETASAEQEDGGASIEEAAASAEDIAESVSAEQEETAEAASAEQDDTAEAASAEQESGASAEDTAETASAEEIAHVASPEETIEAASVEEIADTVSAEQDNTVEATSTEQDGTASAASTEETTEITSAEQDQAVSTETTEAASAEDTAETTSAEEDQAANTEQSEAAASTEQADVPASAETQPSSEQTDSVEGEQADELSAEAGTEDVDSQQTEEEVASTEGEQSQEGESTPEEDLTWEVEVPSELRPREHVNNILNLNDEDAETDNIILKAADKTLNELKRIYENAIKPLETLYKYRDLSNRHFGDPEIFSKPLVLFMGPWSGGKSSIINYLLDNEYTQTSLRTGAEPSPAYFNILMHGEEPEVLDGTQLAADWTFSGLQKFGQGLEERLRGLKLPNRLLEKINIVEIPGILEVRKQVSRMFPFNDACQWFIDRADIIFLVYDPSKLDVGPETEAILDQLKGREYQTRIILNKADQVKPEELMRVQGALIWNISPLMSSAQPPVMYSASLWSRPYESGAPIRLLLAQERAFLRDLRTAVDKRIENKIASARRFAVRVRNHAKMVDCYLTTYYNHKSVFGNKKLVADQIIEHPQDYHIYEGLSTLTNISRYDLPDPDVYRDFFRLNPLYDFQQLSATCTYFRGCPINRLDIAIAYDLPELVGKYKKMIEPATNNNADSSTKS